MKKIKKIFIWLFYYNQIKIKLKMNIFQLSLIRY